MLNIEEEKKQNADKCMRLAEIAKSTGDLEKAERLLLKAERMYPTELAKIMLRDVRTAQGQASEDDGSSHSESSTSDSHSFSSETFTNDGSAERCIQIATEAMESGDYDKARRFLHKSLRMSPRDTTRELIESLRDLEISGSGTYYGGATRPRGSSKEAEVCIEKAQDRIAADELKKAERLLLKAERLHETRRAKDLLRQVREAIQAGFGIEPVKKEPKPIHKQSQENHVRSAPRQPTADEIETIRRVKNAKDDYDILGIPRPSAAPVVNRACRKLMLLLHPDRNKAPGAKEAFMIVVEAADRIKKQLKK